jgi:DNA-directed RNA polymerase subunit K
VIIIIDLTFFYEDLTRFEKTRIISARALQIAMGAPILIKSDMDNPKDIAKAEFEKGVLPITVKRSLPKKGS